MNIIHHLFEEKYVIDLLKKEVLPRYPDFIDIKKIKILAHKNQVWETTYHVVLEFKTSFLTKTGRIKILPIFCSAHSSEPRKNVYHALKYLWDNGFGKGFLTIPHPLFYSEYFNGTFYRGVSGNNLYHYIRNKEYKEIETIIPKAAAWFAKLHKLPTAEADNFNKENSRIKTVFPGRDEILKNIKKFYPSYYETYEKVYDIFAAEEENFLASTAERWLIHGDAHPENVIKAGRKKIAVIDFTDICLSDFARDLGCFLQQLEYMIMRKINDEEYAGKVKDLFLENYSKNAKIKLDDNLRKRINNYYNWTAMRTATFFLLKYKPEPDRSEPLIEKVKNNLDI
ncbi:MAG: aminoglycoside phosphotransferase family protein [Patescibacteria group bacterium]|nr:aminoglycoside phosphotransferase family protein [Patescibacteria group bacterium]